MTESIAGKRIKQLGREVVDANGTGLEYALLRRAIPAFPGPEGRSEAASSGSLHYVFPAIAPP